MARRDNSIVRPSRRPLRGLLRMRQILRGKDNVPHPEERRQARLEGCAMAIQVMTTSQFHRLAEQDRPVVRFTIDGRACEALAGDTLLTALLTNGRSVRSAEFGDG